MKIYVTCGCALFLFLSLSIFPLCAQTARDADAYYQLGRDAMFEEDWYAAAEAFLECLRKNPAHSEGAHALAESYYELGEYDQALVWVRKARSLARLNMATANLEAAVLIAVGRLDEADMVIKDVLSREPYNREALFTASELDIARGHSGDAIARYQNAVKFYGDDRRLLVSLALVLGSFGDYAGAERYIERAQVEHPDDYRVFYFAAYLAARAGKINQAIRDAEHSLALRPAYEPARELLASLRYRAGDYAGAIRLADGIIADNRKDTPAWFLKGMALWRTNRLGDARQVLEAALSIDGEDEFIRAAFEDILIADTALESSERQRWAEYHFKRAEDFKRRNLYDEALFEYRRGLRINPYADARRDYAELLKAQGYPALYLEELKFMVDMGKGSRAINDAVETYTKLLSTALSRQWPVEPAELTPHWNIAIFSIAGQSAFYHTDSGYIAAAYLKDILSHSRNINVMNLQVREGSFASAFRTAREASSGGKRCDYFLLTNIAENERALTFKAELYVARTGAKAADFTIYRTGLDRLRNSSLNIAGQLEAALPFRAVLLRRNIDRGIIDKGRIDGVKSETVYTVIKKGKLELQSEGVGFKYQPQDIAGEFSVSAADEEIAAGTLVRQGYFDVISAGDEIILIEEKTASPAAAAAVDPELRSLLMTLRQ